MLGSSFASHVHDSYTALENDIIEFKQPDPAVIGFDIAQQQSLRRQLPVGGQATVIVYSSERGLLRILGKAYIRLKSWLSYAY
jgi:hypothetical protein